MPTYHLELGAFPRTLTRFNQTGQQLGAIALLWVQDRVIEMDDEKWAPWESSITIVEGPPIPIDGLSMGRGWKRALREGTNVTDRVLGEARQAIADGSAYAQAPAETEAPPATDVTHENPPPASEPARDYPSRAAEPSAPAPQPPTPSPVNSPGDQATLDVGAAELLGAEPERLLVAWRAVAARTGGLAPSESLALAERELLRQDPPGR
jgi:hypothetical protein